MSTQNEWTAFAQSLADSAGEIARRYFGSALDIETKADDSPVSIADRAIEAELRTRIAERFPEHGVFGEEYENSADKHEYVWVIDPIDGTRAFLAGIPTFTTLIALCRDGTPVLGVIDQPIRRERWVGIAGQPTLFNGQPVHTRSCPSLATAVITTTSTEYFSAERKPRFAALAAQCGELRTGGDAYNYAQLASGALDLVVESGLKPYDSLALRPVLEGAGATLTDWAGRPLTFTHYESTLAAGSAALHRQAMQVLG